MEQPFEKENRIRALAGEVMNLSRDELLLHLRFLDVALSTLGLVPVMDLEREGEFALSGQEFLYPVRKSLGLYQREPNELNRTYLHVLLHMIFSHPFGAEKLEPEIWNLACDIAVEQAIMEMDLSCLVLESDRELVGKMRVLREDAGGLTAEKIYRHFRRNPLSAAAKKEWASFTYRDDHSGWKPGEALEMTLKDWQQISRRIRTQLQAFTEKNADGSALTDNLGEALLEKHDYRQILQRFLSMGENITVNEDEFDFIYYTYGLELYGNLPLIEPLEYKEEKKVREFVIVLDTSASCRGKIVRGFLRQTYGLLTSQESYFKTVNIHILQCDSQIQKDTKITCENEFLEFIKTEKLTGFGATDFRPAFAYVDRLREQGEFENLKGLIYFTDGYGIYPDHMPAYQTVFAFLKEDANRPEVPTWAYQAILEEDTLEREADQTADDKSSRVQDA